MKHDPPVRLSTDGKLGADLHPRFNDHARGDGHLVLGGQARVPGPAGLYSIHTSKGTTRCRPRHTRTPLSRRHREVNHVRLRRRRHSPTGTVTAATRRVDTRPALQAGVMRGCLTIALWATVLAGCGSVGASSAGTSASAPSSLARIERCIDRLLSRSPTSGASEQQSRSYSSAELSRRTDRDKLKRHGERSICCDGTTELRRSEHGTSRGDGDERRWTVRVSRRDTA